MFLASINRRRLADIRTFLSDGHHLKKTAGCWSEHHIVIAFSECRQREEIH